MIEKIKWSVDLNINTLENVDTSRMNKDQLIHLVKLSIESLKDIKEYIEVNSK